MILLASTLLLLGSLFCLLAAVGVLRFPDVYTRLHAAAKAGPLGAGLVLFGAGVGTGNIVVVVKCALGLVFLGLVGPVSAHLLARAAYRTATPAVNTVSIDEHDNSR